MRVTRLKFHGERRRRSIARRVLQAAHRKAWQEFLDRWVAEGAQISDRPAEQGPAIYYRGSRIFFDPPALTS